MDLYKGLFYLFQNKWTHISRLCIYGAGIKINQFSGCCRLLIYIKYYNDVLLTPGGMKDMRDIELSNDWVSEIYHYPHKPQA